MPSALRRIAAAYGDPYGCDVANVKIPQTGFAAIGPLGGAMPTESELRSPSWTLPEDWDFLGLFTADGGPAEGTEAGDALTFFQLGYELPSGDDDMTETLILAEDNAAVRRLVYGPNATADGVLYEKTGAIPVGSFPYLRVTRYRNGSEMRRAGIVHVSALETAQETRGEIRAVTVTFAFEFQPDLGDAGLWWYDAYLDKDTPEPPDPPEPPTPTALTVTPATKTLAPGATLKLSVTLDGETIPVSALAAVVEAEPGTVDYVNTYSEPRLVAGANGDGEAVVTFSYQDGEGEWHEGVCVVTVDPEVPALIFDGEPPHLWPDVEGHDTWDTGVFLDLATPMQVSGGDLSWTESTPGVVSIVAVDAGGWDAAFDAGDLGDTAIVFSWDDGLDTVHAGTLNLTVCEQEYPLGVPSDDVTIAVGESAFVYYVYRDELPWPTELEPMTPDTQRQISYTFELRQDGHYGVKVTGRAPGRARLRVGFYRVEWEVPDRIPDCYLDVTVVPAG